MVLRNSRSKQHAVVEDCMMKSLTVCRVYSVLFKTNSIKISSILIFEHSVKLQQNLIGLLISLGEGREGANPGTMYLL